MGYTTDFSGEFSIFPPLTKAQIDYLLEFNMSRRMKRNPALITGTDILRINVGLPLGADGEFYVNATGVYGQDRTPDVIDYNSPPSTQPGLWCQWVPNEDGTALVWDEGEKFYSYVEWLQYMIDSFFIPWGRTLNGEVYWEGEEHSDMGRIIVNDNNVIVQNAVINYE